MFTNTTDTTVKKTLDTLYKNNMTNYTSKLEDTVFCNDITLYSGALASKDTDAGTGASYFSAYNRMYNTYKPSVVCSNESRDGFTVSTSSGGNGKLTYPVGLLTMDEVMLAGGNSSNNSKYYLYTGQWYWALSPSRFDNYNALGFRVGSTGSLGNRGSVRAAGGVRPVVSLAPGTKTSEGFGTVDDPYIID